MCKDIEKPPSLGKKGDTNKPNDGGDPDLCGDYAVGVVTLVLVTTGTPA